MECLDEVTCRGISCPPRQHTNTTFSLALAPRPHDTLFLLRPTAELLSRPSTVLLSILLRQQTHSLQLVISPSPADIPTSPAKMQFTLLTLVTLFAAAIAAPLKGEEDC